MQSLKDIDKLPAIVQASYVQADVLVADTPATITVPAGTEHVLLTPSVDVWVTIGGGAAAVPTTAVTNGTASILVPGGASRLFQTGSQTSISIVTGDIDGGFVCVEVFG